MQEATVINSGLPKIEEALLKQVENFSVEEFGRVANSVRHIVNEQDERAFDRFLVKAAPMVTEWLKNGSITTIPTLIQIVGAYSESELQHELP